MDYRAAVDKKEIAYIRKRKRKAFLESIWYYIFRVFPVKKNRIVVCNFEGKGGFGCNAKYVIMELHRQRPDMEILWLVNPDKNAGNHLTDKSFPEYVKPVSNSIVSRAYYLTTAKVWIDNYRKPLGTKKRQGQYYLNVNHYTIAMKCTGSLRGDGFSEMAYLVSKNDSDMIDHLVIDSKWCEECFDKALVYDGDYLKVGSPRCDVLYGDRSEYRKQFRKRHNIPKDARVVMYAPTFREGATNGKRYVFSEIWSLDFARLLDNLHNRFGGEWYLCVRVHPQLAETFAGYKDEKLEGKLIDESKADDMYEILAAMDAYITDYSSAAFEAAIAKIPTFLYADDVEKYVHDRGDMMWEFGAADRNHIPNNKNITPELDVYLPFTLARDNEELDTDIREFELANYMECVGEFQKGVGMLFDGLASSRIVEKIDILI